MQHDHQKTLYGPNPDASAGKRVRYLNPLQISKQNHTFIIRKDNKELQGKMNEEVVKHIHDMKKNFEAR
jgi:hypothetical protein